MKYISILIFLFGIFSNLLINCVEAIVGGYDAYPGQFTYQVSLKHLWEGHICGGVIIDDRFVLSAAECFINPIGDNFIPGRVAAYLGTRTAGVLDNDNAIAAEVEEIYIPAEYQPRNPEPNDPFREIGNIAVLKLNRSLELNKNSKLSKLELPKKTGTLFKSYSTYEDENATVVGFGYNYVHVGENALNKHKYRVNTTDKLRSAQAKVLTNRACAIKSYPIHSQHLCASIEQHFPGIGEGLCTGDLGNPLVLRQTVIGIVNEFPSECREDKEPSIYTRVSAYVDFIKNVIDGTIEIDDARINVIPPRQSVPTKP